MADQLPDMIPMPDNPYGGESPPELTRQLSPEEEREVLLNFMGSMYGESKKMEGNIIGETNTLKKGGSEEIKKQIEQVFAQPQQSVPQQVQTAPTPIQPVVEEPKIQVEQEVVNDNQLSFNFNVSEKENLLNQIENLTDRVNYNIKLNKELNEKINKIIDNITTTSLPIKKRVKKTS
jgi:hypothetical protein